MCASVYSPLDALVLARQNPDRQVVFFAVGFETTAPANAMAVRQASREKFDNFSILCSHVRVPPAMEAILGAPGNFVQGFLAAGHVCTVMGYEKYEPIAAQHRVPIVVTGFEPLDLLQGIFMAVDALEEGRWGVENQYDRSVRREGNERAIAIINEVFEVCDRQWRGIGGIAMSGHTLRSGFDAAKRFEVEGLEASESPLCIAGEILRGRKKPHECPAFDYPALAPLGDGALLDVETGRLAVSTDSFVISPTASSSTRPASAKWRRASRSARGGRGPAASC